MKDRSVCCLGIPRRLGEVDSALAVLCQPLNEGRHATLELPELPPGCQARFVRLTRQPVVVPPCCGVGHGPRAELPPLLVEDEDASVGVVAELRQVELGDIVV